MNTSRTSMPGGSGGLGLVLTCGFATGLGVGVVWYVTHLPWLDLTQRAALPAILVTWLIGMVATGQAAGRARGWLAGIGSGLVAAIPGLMLLGTRVAEPPEAGARPSVGLMVLGFVALGAGIGLVGGTIGGMLARGMRERGDWLARFAIVAAAAVVPLLMIGGMVTSTDSGMAVPDWPNTFGSNMFLYPLGPRATSNVFFEHSHRLFASMVGLTTLVLMIYVLTAERRTWVKVVACSAFLSVCAQGVLGGQRVILNERVLAMLHGVLAQLTFALLVALAVFLSPMWKSGAGEGIREVEGGRRLRFFTTGLLHATLLQLLLGAAYRQFRDLHSLWSHAGFSIVVLIFAVMAGFAGAALAGEYGGLGPTIRRCGKLLIVVVLLQFLLGWATFSMGGRESKAESVGQALLRTTHQTNGGLTLAAATITFFWTRRLLRAVPRVRRTPVTGP
jgi:cytochrome c oxidase assembly protein subunit 15